MGKLSLSRKPGESFVIYDKFDGAFKPIVVTLKSGSRSQITIEAESNLAIVRAEVFSKRKEMEAEAC